jgi:hypothetical protein
MQSLQELLDLVDSDYLENIRDDDLPASENEIFVVSIQENWNITIKNANDGSSFDYQVSNPVQSVVLVQMDQYFGIYMAGY